MLPYPGTNIVHGEFSSSDASDLSESNSRFTLYGAGKASVGTLAATDQVVVTDVKVMVGSSALTVTLYDGSDATVDAGETITVGDYAANGGEAQNFSCPHVCQSGTYPKVKTSGAGAVKVQLRGYIRRAGA